MKAGGKRKRFEITASRDRRKWSAWSFAQEMDRAEYQRDQIEAAGFYARIVDTETKEEIYKTEKEKKN